MFFSVVVVEMIPTEFWILNAEFWISSPLFPCRTELNQLSLSFCVLLSFFLRNNFLLFRVAILSYRHSNRSTLSFFPQFCVCVIFQKLFTFQTKRTHQIARILYRYYVIFTSLWCFSDIFPPMFNVHCECFSFLLLSNMHWNERDKITYEKRKRQ